MDRDGRELLCFGYFTYFDALSIHTAIVHYAQSDRTVFARVIQTFTGRTSTKILVNLAIFQERFNESRAESFEAASHIHMLSLLSVRARENNAWLCVRSLARSHGLTCTRLGWMSLMVSTNHDAFNKLWLVHNNLKLFACYILLAG